MEDQAMPLDKLTRIYMKMKVKLKEIEAEYEAKKKEIDDQLNVVKNELKDQMQALGTKSVRTEYGTLVLSPKTRYWTQDWDAFKSFVVEHDALDLFERRIAQKNMALFLEANPTLFPPGLNAESTFDLSVRKPTN